MISLSKVGMGQSASMTIVGGSTYTYNGSPQFNLISTSTSTTGGCFQNTGTTYTYSGTDFNGVAYNSSSIAPTNAGNYQIIASANFSSCGLVNSNTITFTINKAIPIVTINSGLYTYNGSQIGPNLASNDGTSTSYSFIYSGTT
ncbi:MAG: hypothetical protein ACK5BD_01480, partial [Chitinophagaceae bacterium]